MDAILGLDYEDDPEVSISMASDPGDVPSTPPALGRQTSQTPPPQPSRALRPPTAPPRSSSFSSRKQLKSSSSASGSESVRVMCRFRPENAQEQELNAPLAVRFDEHSDRFVNHTTHHNNREHRFKFDKVFQPYSTQQEVYDQVGMPIVNSVLEGFNAAVIAYGQTGAGKTYTMLGPGYDGNDTKVSVDEQVEAALQDPGLIPRMMQGLFSQVAIMENDDEEFVLRASYIEIYMEKVKDLLAPHALRENESLKIRADRDRGLYLPDATEVPLRSLVDVFAVLRMGAQYRRTAETQSNKHSSRSHAIFVVTMARRNHVTKVNKISQLYLVDLAGSEKAAKTNVRGRQMKEAQKINQSLLALGNVIFALAGSKKKKKKYIPYRNSKLTRLLQNCIGGNAKTTLIINCSPSSYNDKETLSTLRFGDRTKQIKNIAVVNEEISVAELKYLLNKAREENAQLKRTVTTLQNNLQVMQQIQDFENYQDKRTGGNSDSKSSSGNATNNSSSSSNNSSSSGSSSGAGTVSVAQHNDTAANLASAQRSGRLRELLLHFLCPLGRSVMVDPVFALDGFTYERRTIETYLKSHSVSPMTGLQLPGKLLVPNHNLKTLITAYYPKELLKREEKLSLFYVVPLDVITVIFSFLPHRALCRAAGVCREWNSLAANDRLWKPLVLSQFQTVDPKVLAEHPKLKVYFAVQYQKLHPSGSKPKYAPKSFGIRLVPKAT